jgi:hypothetical protein
LFKIKLTPAFIFFIVRRVKNKEWISVFTASGLGEAYIIKGRLESEGIPVKLSYEAIGKIYGLTVDGLGEVHIMVPKEDVERAKTILDSCE